MAWTAPRTWTDGELVTKAIMDPHVRDNFLATGPHLIVRKSSDESVTSSTVLQNDDALLMAVGVNEVWEVHLHLYVTGGAGDLQAAWTYPAGGAVAMRSIAPNATATLTFWNVTAASGTAWGDYDTSTLTTRFITVEGLYIGAGTGGTLTLQWAQAASSGTATIVKANSTLWAVKLA